MENDEWISLKVLLANAKHSGIRVKLGLASMEKLGLIESRKSPETNEREYHITSNGIMAGLNWNNFGKSE